MTAEPLFWFQLEVEKEILRLEALSELPYPAKGIAGNLRFAESDVIRWARQMGFDVDAPARWQYGGAWIGRAS